MIKQIKFYEGQKNNFSPIYIKNFPFGYITGIMRCFGMHIISKRIELESPGWSGFVANLKPDQT